MFWPGEFHGQRSLAGYSPWGCKEWDTVEQLSLCLSWGINWANGERSQDSVDQRREVKRRQEEGGALSPFPGWAFSVVHWVPRLFYFPVSGHVLYPADQSVLSPTSLRSCSFSPLLVILVWSLQAYPRTHPGRDQRFNPCTTAGSTTDSELCHSAVSSSLQPQEL